MLFALKDLSSISSYDFKACCQATQYSDCECFISPHIPTEEVEMDQNIRDLLCALIGFPLGLGIKRKKKLTNIDMLLDFNSFHVVSHVYYLKSRN